MNQDTQIKGTMVMFQFGDPNMKVFKGRGLRIERKDQEVDSQ